MQVTATIICAQNQSRRKFSVCILYLDNQHQSFQQLTDNSVQRVLGLVRAYVQQSISTRFSQSKLNFVMIHHLLQFSLHWIIHRIQTRSRLWEASFPVNELWYMGLQVSSSAAWIMCRWSITSCSNSKCLEVILVPAANVITVIGTVHFSSWLHKQLLKMSKIHAVWQLSVTSHVVKIYAN